MDGRRRAAERELQATGADDALARILVERVRSGELSSARLELAALCGHPAARAALGADMAEPPAEERRWRRAASPLLTAAFREPVLALMKLGAQLRVAAGLSARPPCRLPTITSSLEWIRTAASHDEMRAAIAALALAPRSSREQQSKRASERARRIPE